MRDKELYYERKKTHYKRGYENGLCDPYFGEKELILADYQHQAGWFHDRARWLTAFRKDYIQGYVDAIRDKRKKHGIEELREG